MAMMERRRLPLVGERILGADLRNAFYISPLTHPLLAQALVRARAATAVWTQWFGNVEVAEAAHDQRRRGETVPGWQASLQQLADANICVVFNSRVTADIPGHLYAEAAAILGDCFLGFNEGEWDGAYVLRVANPGRAHGIRLSPGRSRAEAAAQYRDWMRAIYARHHDHLVTTSSLGFGCHYAAGLGSRMLGLELGERLPSDALLLAFCRGACRQYGLRMQAYPAVYSVRGVKLYPRADQPQSFYHAASDHQCGPQHGTSLGLLKRLWWAAHMSGASVIGIQGGHFPVDADAAAPSVPLAQYVPIPDPVDAAAVRAHLTLLGRLYEELRAAARRVPVRCRPYTPVAIMLADDHGWSPQPNIYSRSAPECVWGNIPWGPGDRQIARFFDWVYPGYRDGGAREDERGKLPGTPFGDLFDVVLADADAACLRQYRMLVLLGDLTVDAGSPLAQRLTTFVEGGGTLVIDSAQWPSLSVVGGVPGVPVDDWSLGARRILRVAAATWDVDGDGFAAACRALAPQLQALAPIIVDGPPLHVLTSVTAQPDTIAVSLSNEDPDEPWSGRITLRDADIAGADCWLGEQPLMPQAGGLHLTLPPNDVVCCMIRASAPLALAPTGTIDWLAAGPPRHEPAGLLDEPL
jgi:hypothetical protein